MGYLSQRREAWYLLAMSWWILAAGVALKGVIIATWQVLRDRREDLSAQHSSYPGATARPPDTPYGSGDAREALITLIPGKKPGEFL